MSKTATPSADRRKRAVTTITFPVPRDLKTAVLRAAEADKRSVSAWIRVQLYNAILRAA